MQRCFGYKTGDNPSRQYQPRANRNKQRPAGKVGTPARGYEIIAVKVWNDAAFINGVSRGVVGDAAGGD